MIKSIKLNGFRNYKNYNLDFDHGLNVIIGDNGVGKTNILEAIYTLIVTKSFKKIKDNNLINKSSEYYRIEAIINDKKYISFYDKNGKQILINNLKQPKLSGYIKNNQVIFFGPDEFYIIKGTPKERRNYFNLMLSQYDNEYINTLIKYNKLVKIKSNYLKETNIDESLIKVYNEQITKYAIYIIKMRVQFISEINQIINNYWHRFYKEKSLKIKYSPKNYDLEGITEDKLLKKYNEFILKEIKYRNTLIGPHLDDFFVYLDNEKVYEIASEGQTKLIILALKLSEITLFNEKFNKQPIILFDDLFSELDNTNSNKLLNLLSNQLQIIITTPNINDIDEQLIKNAKVISIKGEEDDKER